MPDGSAIYYKVRDVVRLRGHAESEMCRVFKDWHIELRLGRATPACGHRRASSF